MSKTGLQEAERRATSLNRYPEIYPYRINQQQIRHYLLAQSSTVTAHNAGVIVEFETERMFAQDGDKSGIKRPDAVWVTPTKRRIAIEIELSKKWDRDLDTFILGIINALTSSKKMPARFDRFMVFTESVAIESTYKEKMQPGTALNIWRKNKRGHWIIETTIKVPDWLIGKVDFKFLER